MDDDILHFCRIFTEKSLRLIPIWEIKGVTHQQILYEAFPLIDIWTVALNNQVLLTHLLLFLLLPPLPIDLLTHPLLFLLLLPLPVPFIFHKFTHRNLPFLHLFHFYYGLVCCTDINSKSSSNCTQVLSLDFLYMPKQLPSLWTQISVRWLWFCVGESTA